MIRLSLLLTCLLSVACVSGQKVVDPEAPVEIGFYQDGVRQLTLVNEAHSDRVELYSTKSSDASTKVATNETMDVLLDRFEEHGFFDLATPGSAPSVNDGRTLEIQAQNGALHFYVGPDSSPESWKSFTSCRVDFVELWNGIFAPQSVENTQGEAIFGTRRTR